MDKQNIKKIEEQFSIATIFHEGFAKFLDKHLQSIDVAQNKYGKKIKMNILLSNYNDTKVIEDAMDTIKRYTQLDISIYKDRRRMTCASARNYIISYANTPWVVLFDIDVLIDADYFKSVNELIKEVDNIPQVAAIGGSIGTWGTKGLGYYEYLMDMYAYYGKMNNGVRKNIENLKKYWVTKGKPIPEALLSLDKNSIHYLQGFNQIIRKSTWLSLGRYNDNFFGAEDREMAARFYSKGYKVIFGAKCIVYHYYNFTLKDVINRKYGHGYYSSMYRNLYKKTLPIDYGIRKWVKYFGTLFVLPRSFWSIKGYYYYHVSFWTYLLGSIVLHTDNITAKLKIQLIRYFTYSNYHFTKDAKF